VEKIKRWFINLPFAILLCVGLLSAWVHKLRTGENIFSDFAVFMGPVKESRIADGVAEGIEALSITL
jgi:hypothetical protein